VTAPERFGPYLLLDRINVGGMAEVFRGKQVGVEGFERLVALKRILPRVSSDPDFIEMFVDEAKIAVKLQHANIAQTYDLGKVDGQYYIALEYVSGVDLRTIWDRARRRKRLLPVAMSAYIVQKVCEGLDAAHQKRDEQGREIGLVHRDVSPHNILCSYEGEVKIIDFGIAKVSNKVSKTHAGALKGKFGYMSPEQVRGIDLDKRSDIFTCGTVLAELLVGRRLFPGDSDFQVLEKIRNGRFRRPTELNPRIEPALEAVVLKALQTDRDARYETAGDMAADLSAYLYATDQRYGRPDLARYLQRHFEADMAAERSRLERYRSVGAASGGPEPSVAASDRGSVGPAARRHGAAATGRPPGAPAAHSGPPGASVAASTTPAAARAGAPRPAPAENHAAPAIRSPAESYLEGTAPGMMTGSTAGPMPARLPTWAAMLIGALAVVALGSLVALGWVLTNDEPEVRVIQNDEPTSSAR